MTREEIIEYFEKNNFYLDDKSVIIRMNEEELRYLYGLTIKYGELYFSELSFILGKDIPREEIEKKVSSRVEYAKRMKVLAPTPLIVTPEKPVLGQKKCSPKEVSSSSEMKPQAPSNDDNFLVEIVADIRRIIGSVDTDPDQRFDIPSFIWPKDHDDPTKIDLHTFLSYLSSNVRRGFHESICYRSEFEIEHASGWNNKYRALIDLESKLFGYDDRFFRGYRMGYEKNDMGEIVIPDTLFGIKIQDIIDNPRDELNAYLIGLFVRFKIKNGMGLPIDLSSSATRDPFEGGSTIIKK